MITIILIPSLFLLAWGLVNLFSLIENKYYSRYRKVLNNNPVLIEYSRLDERFQVNIILGDFKRKSDTVLSEDELKNLLGLHGFYSIGDICEFFGHANHYKFEKWFSLNYKSLDFLKRFKNGEL